MLRTYRVFDVEIVEVNLRQATHKRVLVNADHDSGFIIVIDLPKQ
jgi:hypothetical protein